MTKPSALQVGGKKAKGRTSKATKTHKRKSMSKKMRHTKKHHKGGDLRAVNNAKIINDFLVSQNAKMNEDAIKIKEALKKADIHYGRKIGVYGSYYGDIIGDEKSRQIDTKYTDLADKVGIYTIGDKSYQIRVETGYQKIMIRVATVTAKVNDYLRLAYIKRHFSGMDKRAFTAEIMKLINDLNKTGYFKKQYQTNLSKKLDDNKKEQIDAYTNVINYVESNNPMIAVPFDETDKPKGKISSILSQFVPKLSKDEVVALRGKSAIHELTPDQLNFSSESTLTVEDIRKDTISKTKLNQYILEKKPEKSNDNGNPQLSENKSMFSSMFGKK